MLSSSKNGPLESGCSHERVSRLVYSQYCVAFGLAIADANSTKTQRLCGSWDRHSVGNTQRLNCLQHIADFSAHCSTCGVSIACIYTRFTVEVFDDPAWNQSTNAVLA
jgi:hypothetical protein